MAKTNAKLFISKLKRQTIWTSTAMKHSVISQASSTQTMRTKKHHTSNQNQEPTHSPTPTISTTIQTSSSPPSASTFLEAKSSKKILFAPRRRMGSGEEEAQVAKMSRMMEEETVRWQGRVCCRQVRFVGGIWIRSLELRSRQRMMRILTITKNFGVFTYKTRIWWAMLTRRLYRIIKWRERFSI